MKSTANLHKPAAGEKTVWFITGCSTGFGRELAKQVLELGYRVVVTARRPAEIKDLGKEFSAWEAVARGADFPKTRRSPAAGHGARGKQRQESDHGTQRRRRVHRARRCDLEKTVTLTEEIQP